MRRRSLGRRLLQIRNLQTSAARDGMKYSRARWVIVGLLCLATTIHRTQGQIDAIGVDNIQYAKGHKYLTLVYHIDPGVTRLLWVGRGTIESFHGFFAAIGDEVASRIVFVCSDIWEPYLTVIRERCSEALHILGRFHIAAKMNKALDEVRAGESPRMDLPPFLTQMVKTQNPLNGELSHGVVTQAVHEGV